MIKAVVSTERVGAGTDWAREEGTCWGELDKDQGYTGVLICQNIMQMLLSRFAHFTICI